MRLRRYLPLALLAAALAAAATAAPAQPAAGRRAWVSFEPPSKLFTAQFPSAPAHETRLIDQGTHKETAHRYSVTQPGRAGALFEIMHMKLPPNDGGFDGLLLDTTLDTALTPIRQRGGREVARSEITHKGCVGRELVAAEANGMTVHSRLFIAGGQLFNISHVAPTPSDAGRQAARRFLDSFTLAAPCPPPPAPTPMPEPKRLGKVSGTPDAATGWVLIAPPQSGFSALMPSAPEAEEEPAQEKPFPLTMHTYSAEDDAAIYLALECGDFPEEVSRVENFDEMMMNLGHRALLSEFGALGVKVIPEGDVTVSGYAGRRYRLAEGAASGTALVVTTPRKFYFFAAYAYEPTPPTAKFERFFSSIKLGATPPPAAPGPRSRP